MSFLTMLAAEVASGAEPSAGVRMRRARFALLDGRTPQAVADLQAVREKEPGSARGLESALMLADVAFTAGDPQAADHTLGEAEKSFADADSLAALALARGWVALGALDGKSASTHFARASSQARPELARHIADVGGAWAAMEDDRSAAVTDTLRNVALRATDPALRFAVGLTRARALAASGDHRRALQALRALRKLARGTAYADDLDLQIGLVALDAGKLEQARTTFRRMARQSGASGVGSAPPLTLDDLRLPPRAFAGRIAALYVARPDRQQSLTVFLAALLDRPAANDVPQALALVEAAIAARKGA
jgi:tetratricopeptide (TPR) repeat protein